MARGLTYLSKPYVSRIMIENTTDAISFSKKWIDLYTDQTEQQVDNDKSTKLRITFDLSWKSLYPSVTDCTTIQQVKANITQLSILRYRVTSPQKFKEFLNKGTVWAHSNLYFKPGTTTTALPPILPDDFPKYVYDHENKKIVSIPHVVSDIYEYSDLDAAINGNPQFLAYIFVPHPYSSISDPPFTFASEIIFKDGTLVTTTTYFEIGDQYKKGQKTYNLLEDTDAAKKVKKSFGMPGQLWCGSLYKMNGVFMAGSSYDAAIGCPILKMYTTRNDKIVDVRVAQSIGELYTYQSSDYEKSLSFITSPTFTNYQQYKVVDNFFPKNNGILTELDYSVRTFTSADDDSIAPSAPPADKICLFFGIDKGRLLKSTTALPGLLDRITAFNPDFLSYFIDRINISRFQIMRTDMTTKETAILIIGDNGNYFDDAASADPEHKPVARRAKGHRLRRLGFGGTAGKIKIANDDSTISFYEFRDGEIHVDKYNNETFKYSIKLSFRDPIWDYLNSHLNRVRTITQDLDKLLLITSLKMFDGKLNKTVAIFDQFYQKMNPEFVRAALQNISSIVPFQFATDGPYAGAPQSIVDGFGYYSDMGTSKFDNLALLLHAIAGNMSTLVAMADYQQQIILQGALGGSYHSDIGDYLINSTKLPTTTPTLLEKARSILTFLEDKLSKVLSVYSREIKNKSTAPGANAYTDFLKNQGNLSHPAMINEIQIEETFEKEIKLAKAKNRFDWLRNMGPSAQPFYSLKVIRSGDYINTIEQTFNYLKTDTMPLGVEWLLHDYWFLPPYTMNPRAAENISSKAVILGLTPLSGKGTFELFNYAGSRKRLSRDQNTQVLWQNDFEDKFYQVMRKEVLGRHSDTRKNVSMLEVLSYFGIRGPINSILAEGPLKILAMGGPPTSDADTALVPSPLNFQEAGDSGDQEQEMDADGNPTGKLITKTGGVTEKDTAPGAPYEWGGASKKNWDIMAAKKIINLLFSDNAKKDNYRNLSLFNANSPFMQKRVAPSGPAGWLAPEVAPTMNLVAMMANLDALGSAASPFIQDNIFYESGALRLENYHLYILFLCLFGKVEYLHGFTQRPPISGLTPTSFHYRNLMRSYEWRNLTKMTIQGLQKNDFLYCRVRLSDEGALIDNNYIRMFTKYFTNNQHFYMGASTLYAIAPEEILPELTIATAGTTAITDLTPVEGTPFPGTAGPGPGEIPAADVVAGLAAMGIAPGGPTPGLGEAAPAPPATGNPLKVKKRMRKSTAKKKKKLPKKKIGKKKYT